MKFHLPSFLLGCAVGALAMPVIRKLRPALVELATAGYHLAESGMAAIVSRREDLEDLLAEAKARVWPEPTPLRAVRAVSPAKRPRPRARKRPVSRRPGAA